MSTAHLFTSSFASHSLLQPSFNIKSSLLETKCQNENTTSNAKVIDDEKKLKLLKQQLKNAKKEQEKIKSSLKSKDGLLLPKTPKQLSSKNDLFKSSLLTQQKYKGPSNLISDSTIKYTNVKTSSDHLKSQTSGCKGLVHDFKKKNPLVNVHTSILQMGNIKSSHDLLKGHSSVCQGHLNTGSIKTATLKLSTNLTTNNLLKTSTCTAPVHLSSSTKTQTVPG
jgi:hypothetical protein